MAASNEQNEHNKNIHQKKKETELNFTLNEKQKQNLIFAQPEKKTCNIRC